MKKKNFLNKNASTKLPFHIDRRGMNSEFLRFDSAPTLIKKRQASSYSYSFSSFIVVGPSFVVVIV